MPAISEARLNANRRNALKSTGPRTPEGKAKASLNAVRHALTAQRVTSMDESPEAFEAVRQQLYDEWRPASVLEIALVDQIAELVWRRRRVGSVESSMLESKAAFASRASGNVMAEMFLREFCKTNSAILRLQVYQMRIDSALHRAVAQLRQLQRDRQERDQTPLAETDAFELDPIAPASAPKPAAMQTPAPSPAPSPAPAPVPTVPAQIVKTNPPANVTVAQLMNRPAFAARPSVGFDRPAPAKIMLGTAAGQVVEGLGKGTAHAQRSTDGASA